MIALANGFGRMVGNGDGAFVFFVGIFQEIIINTSGLVGEPSEITRSAMINRLTPTVENTDAFKNTRTVVAR